jgi:hypothetical protein
MVLDTKPFNRYFLFGINEDTLGRLKDDQTAEIEEFLDENKNLTVKSFCFCKS